MKIVQSPNCCCGVAKSLNIKNALRLCFGSTVLFALMIFLTGVTAHVGNRLAFAVFLIATISTLIVFIISVVAICIHRIYPRSPLLEESEL